MSTGSIAGYQNTMVGGEIAMKRKIMRKAFMPNTVKVNNVTIQSTMGPFRSSIHLGDFLSRKNQTCGGCNQVNDVNSRILRTKMADGVSNNSCDVITAGVTPLQVPLGSGNSKYVSDSSLFTRFKGLESLSKLYNDNSYGGNKYHGSQSAIMRVRRY